MVLYIGISVLVIFMGWFVNSSYNKKNIENPGTAELSRQQLLNRVLLLAIFLVLFAVSALRIGIGNDYWEYRYRFLDIAGGDNPVSYELGFRVMVRIMQLLFGLDNYRTTFALVSFLTVGFAIKGIYDSADWFFYSLFLFMCNGFYFMSFSNIRYYLVFAVVIFAIQFVWKERPGAFIAWILAAAFFHKTVLLVIPVYYVAYYWKWTKKNVWLIPVACLGLFFGRIPIRWVLFKFYPYYEGDLLYDVSTVSWVNIAKCLAILVFCLIFYKDSIKGNKKAEMLFNLNLFALIIYCFGTYIPQISRVCYYMVLGHMFLIPMVLMGIKDRKKRVIFTSLVSLAYVGYYLVFLKSGYNPNTMFLPYLTWLFT